MNESNHALYTHHYHTSPLHWTRGSSGPWLPSVVGVEKAEEQSTVRVQSASPVFSDLVSTCTVSTSGARPASPGASALTPHLVPACPLPTGHALCYPGNNMSSSPQGMHQITLAQGNLSPVLSPCLSYGPQYQLPVPVVRCVLWKGPTARRGPVNHPLPWSHWPLIPRHLMRLRGDGISQSTAAECTFSSFWLIPHIVGGLSGKRHDLNLTAQSLTIYLKQTVTARTVP